MTPDRKIDRAIFFYFPEGDRLINAGNPMLFELFRKREVRRVVFGGDDEAACILVDSMHDARTEDAADAGKAVAAVMEQGGDERSRVMTGGGMHDHAFWLVHDDDILVLIPDINRNILCLGAAWRGQGIFDLNIIGFPQLVIFRYGKSAVDKHTTILDQLLNTGAGERRLFLRKENVEARARVFICRRYRFFDGFRHLAELPLR